MYISLQALRAKVRGFQAEGRSIGARIRRSKGARRHQLWLKKRQLGNIARDHQIAYCLLRGTPYHQIESKCAETNKPDPRRVFEIVRAHADWKELPTWSEQRIAALLVAPEASQEKRLSP